MKKYFFVYKSELMSTLQYMLNILLKLIGFILHIYIFMNLWNYIYDDPSKLINGYSKNQMIWYVIVTEIIWGAVNGRKYCRRISDDVKSGNIAYLMNKPYSYIGYSISSHLGETTIRTIISIAVGFTFGIVFLKEFPILSITEIIIVLISGILAVFISLLLITFIGLISFIIEDATPIYWIYSKMILILGVIFPVEFFPGVLKQIIMYSPIYVTCYGPAKLFVDFSYQMALKIFIFQLIYIGIAWLMCRALYEKGVRRLNVTGG